MVAVDEGAVAHPAAFGPDARRRQKKARGGAGAGPMVRPVWPAGVSTSLVCRGTVRWETILLFASAQCQKLWVMMRTLTLSYERSSETSHRDGRSVLGGIVVRVRDVPPSCSSRAALRAYKRHLNRTRFPPALECLCCARPTFHAGDHRLDSGWEYRVRRFEGSIQSLPS